MTRAWRWLLTALCCVCALPAAGATASLRIDSTHSHAEFGVHVLWFGKVVGRLDALHGRVRIDTNGQARVDVVVDTRSLRMPNTDYEAFASGPGFFDSARYPFIDFRSVPFPVKHLGTGGPVEGALTLRGITHTVRFDLLPQPCAWFADTSGASTTDTPAAASSAAPAVATAAPALAASASSAAGTAPAVAATQAVTAPADRGTCRVLARGYIERSRFGMRGHRFIIGDRVELDLVLRVRRSSVTQATPDATNAAPAVANPAVASSANLPLR